MTFKAHNWEPIDWEDIYPISEFRELGLIAEINRRVLHPIGLALATDRTEATLFVVRTEDPEGMIFPEDGDWVEKCSRAERLRVECSEPRMTALGFIEQPVPRSYT